MNWDSFNTQHHSFTRAFEIFCTQLFERHIYRAHRTQLSRYAVLDGAGGDGGVEAYAEFLNGGITGLQAKGFRTAMTASQVRQIKSSIDTAMAVPPGLTEYIICVPRNLTSKKKIKGGKVSLDNEEEKVRTLGIKIKALYPKLKLTWWFDSELLSQLQLDESNGIRRFWFEKTALSLPFLQERFAVQRTNSWLKNRYAADLNGQGKFAEIYEQLTLGPAFQTSLAEKLQNALDQIGKTINLISLFLKPMKFPQTCWKNSKRCNTT